MHEIQSTIKGMPQVFNVYSFYLTATNQRSFRGIFTDGTINQCGLSRVLSKTDADSFAVFRTVNRLCPA